MWYLGSSLDIYVGFNTAPYLRAYVGNLTKNMLYLYACVCVMQ